MKAQYGTIYQLDDKFYVLKKAPITFTEVDKSGKEIKRQMSGLNAGLTNSTYLISQRLNELKPL